VTDRRSVRERTKKRRPLGATFVSIAGMGAQSIAAVRLPDRTFRLSTRTVSPRDRNRSTSFDPRSPLPPVTRIVAIAALPYHKGGRR